MFEVINILRLVPELISTIFGFLPSWVLVIVGSGSLLFIGMVVYKLIR